MSFSTDIRHDYYITRCEQCRHRKEFDAAPFKATRTAIKHSRAKPNHKVAVINITRLETVSVHLYEPVELPMDGTAPF